MAQASTLETKSYNGPADLSDAGTRQQMSAAGFKAFTRIMEAWNISQSDSANLLGGMSLTTYKRNISRINSGDRSIPPLDQDELTRISLLLGIVKSLRILFGRENADRWFTQRNTGALFQGRSPMEFVQSGGIIALDQVRQLVDAQRGYLT